MTSQRFFADLDRFFQIDYPQYEIIAVTDRPVDLPGNVVRVIETGATLTGPAEKRDLGLAHSRGELCAFIDDDAYPHSLWLRHAARHFQDPQVGAVGGPGVTPPGDGLWERAGGAVLESWLGSGGYRYRFAPDRAREVDDYPAYNLIVRRSVLEEVGGYGSTFYGGEDTVLCIKIRERGHRILYDPEAIVYHHRRPLWRLHLRQIGLVGTHRGYFVKAYPVTSLRLSYFLPSLGLLAWIGLGAAALVFEPARVVLSLGLVAYLLSGLASAWAARQDFRIAGLAALAIPLTHWVYGVAFIRGLTLRRLTR